MRTPTRTTALILAGAVGIGTVAYGVGTQVDGGSASAARDGNGNGGGGWQERSRHLGNLADELGVSKSELQDALRDFHAQQQDEHGDDFAAALADALGKSTEEVQAALDSLRDKHRARFAAKLARALGVDAGRVKAALEELEDADPGDFASFPEALADKLGLKAADVEEALSGLRPPQRFHRRGAPLRQLAKALDVTRAELRAALREVRGNRGADWEDRRQDLVEFLADRFGLSTDKVDEALPDFAGGPGPGGGWDRRGGPGGPPGGFGGPGGPPGGFGGPGGPPGGPGGPPGGPGGFGGPPPF
jgi:biotin operon repressor